MFDIIQLNEMLVPELRDVAENLGLKSYKRLSKQDLIYKILDEQALVGEKSKPTKANESTKAEKVENTNTEVKKQQDKKP
ncbi:MAG TPA: Rho termination factor N-terminal domain-containing protein, partial [Saprospiraceae bacterium]|nr:Rho termination factor N-terminal domain-containing protein [Saprospiraceae bacterium]